eukprot:TCONS_00009554-protein
MGQKKKNNNKAAKKPAGPVTYEVTVGTPSNTGRDKDRKLRDEAEKEAQQAMQVAFIQQMNETQRSYKTDDGDQSQVTGDDAIKLKWKWASGLDWNPSNMLLSTWLRVLAAGDYDGMLAEIAKTPEGELKDLLERRETLYNFSALFHVIKGASTTLDETGRQYNAKTKFVDRSKQPKHLQCAAKLIELGANVNARDMLGATPLFFCVMRYRNPVTMKIGKILLDNGAEINATSRLGETALLQPVMMKRFDCVDFLMKYGADPSIRDYEGGCPQDMSVMDSEIKEHLNPKEPSSSVLDKLVCSLCDQFYSKSRCTACFLVRYCSKECQLVHWDKHKKACKENKKKFTQLPLIVAGDKKDGLPSDNFIAKVELVLSEEEGNKMLVYEETKGLLGHVVSSEAVYGVVETKLKSKGSDSKAYFQAVVDTKQNIKINFNDFVTLELEW